MKAALLVLSLSLASGCAHMDRATLVASTATLACDWAQTRSMASDNWQGFQEMNPVMGSSPSTGQVDLYFVSAALINYAAWHFTPKGWRSALPAAMTAVQAETIIGNAPHTGWCGI